MVSVIISIIEKVNAEGIVITKHGKPLVKLIPIEEQSLKLIGKMKGKIKIKGDIMCTMGDNETLSAKKD